MSGRQGGCPEGRLEEKGIVKGWESRGGVRIATAFSASGSDTMFKNYALFGSLLTASCMDLVLMWIYRSVEEKWAWRMML